MTSRVARFVAAIGVCGLSAFLGDDRPATASDDDAVRDARHRADAVAEQLPKRLMAELGTALQAGGPAAGVEVCAGIAQPLTREAGEKHALVVRRTSEKYRNPANAPDAFERAWLQRAMGAIRDGHLPEPTYDVVARPDGTAELRHLRPIIFPGGLCSQCHGGAAEMPPEVRAMLRERYPEDRATGFAPGDLRGAISVRVPLPDRTPLSDPATAR
jgi:hypothetical protein